MDRIQGLGGADEDGGAEGRRPGPARITQLDCGDFVLTVNPVDGSEIEPRRPDAPQTTVAKRSAEDRAALAAAALPPVPAGAALDALPELPLLERDADRERLVGLLSRGRSVRVTGPAGSGRSALLDAVAADCAGLAPDGVVRLSGHRQSAADLLHALYAAVYDAPRRRPGHRELLDRVGEIGAVVVIDDLETGGAGLEELLRATPECAFLIAVAPDTAAATADGHLEEVALAGLTKPAAAALLERAAMRPLTAEETAWADDLWFASEGLPRHFVQAAALLRQRDAINHVDEDDDEDEPGVFEERAPEAAHVGLPTLGQAAAPAVLLASRLSESGRAALRFAVALGGELPHQAHLPALVGDTHADTAVGELLGCGLLTPVGSRYRLAAGVVPQLEEAGYGDEAAERALTAAQHYTWWTGHGSVTPERAAAEADAVLAVLATLVPGQGDGGPSAAVLLARTAAPAFAGGLQWGAWERILRAGQEAARIAGEVAEEAYFHHERGILALCNEQLDRARAELEASIGLRGALADKRGTVAGRRALALVDDREGGPRAAGPVSPPLVLEAPKPSEAMTQGLPQLDFAAETPPIPDAVKAAFPRLTPPSDVTATPPQPVVAVLPPVEPGESRPSVLRGARRNVLAAAAGAVLVAVLGTAVTLGLGGGDRPVGEQQRNGRSVSGGASSAPATDDPAGATTRDPGGGSTPGAAAGGPGATGPVGTVGSAGPTGSSPGATGSPSATPPGTSPTPSRPGSSRPTPPSTSGTPGGGTSSPGTTGTTTGDPGTTGTTTGDPGTTGTTTGDPGTTGTTTGDPGTTGTTTGDPGTTGTTTGDPGTTGTTTGDPGTTGDAAGTGTGTTA
ncbi:ATP-binding protein [Streptomyces sp. NBC_00239]|uniref:ATP-binding protein n=1 Tax=Streptomyces sp. NBC_00239 TaxID=2903640 RepID=UPI002E2E31A4|nr:ATP-binding protein [Streptomyces sp. NBC_00239]